MMSKPKILIVEDEGITAMEIEKLMESSGYLPYITKTHEAIEMAVKTKPDLIIMDIKLEGKNNGLKTTEKIKEFQDVPIIYLITYFNEDILESAKLKPYAYIIKPFDEDELLKNIKIALNNGL